MSKNLIAAIDVGSHAIRMKIGEINKAGDFRLLEKFRKIAVLGHDTFTNEKVSFESVDKTCEILKNFRMTMDDYGVKRYVMMATSAIREASNKDYIMDQIKLKTGLDIRIIDNSQEQYLTLKALKHKLEHYNKITAEGAVVIVIGAGSIQITTFLKGELKSSQNVKMGALRIKEILGALENQTTKYYKVLREYIEANLEDLDFLKDKGAYKHLIVIGGEIGVIQSLMDEDVTEETYSMKKKDFRVISDEIMSKTTDEIKRDYAIKRERAEIIVPSLMLINMFVDKTTAGEIIIPNISLADGIIRYIHEDIYNLHTNDISTQDIITSATVMAKKFNYDETHCNHVEAHALLLFDKLRKIHGMKEERILLRVATILHDIGKFISLDHHNEHSYNLIKSLELFGMSTLEVEMVANIARYHGIIVPKDQDRNLAVLPTRERIIVAKLIGIIRMADALDRSHKQKIKIESVRVKDKELIIRGKSVKNTTLEEWNFAKKSEFFKEVFGIKPVLIIKREL